MSSSPLRSPRPADPATEPTHVQGPGTMLPLSELDYKTVAALTQDNVFISACKQNGVALDFAPRILHRAAATDS